MKKIYLSLITLLFLLSANATERVWNFTRGFAVVDHSTSMLAAPETWTSVKEAGVDYAAFTATKCTSSCNLALELCKNYKIINKTKTDTATTFGGFLQTLQFYGSATVPTAPAIPTTDYIAINVAGNVDISFYCNPATAVSRTFRVVNSSGVVVNTIVTSAISSIGNTGTEVIKVSYVGPATKLTIYPAYDNTASVYLYAVIVNDNPPTSIINTSATIALKKAGDVLLNDNAEEVEIYTIMGAKVLASSATSIDISALASGMYIAKTASGSLKFVK